MNKKKVVLYIFLIFALLCTSVYATISGDISISASKTTVSPGEELSVTLKITDVTFKGGIDSKEKLDKFIEKYRDKYHLKFSTLDVCNDWTRAHQNSDWLDDIGAKKVVLFNEIEGLFYKDTIIKRYDRLLNPNAEQSYKCHVDGVIKQSWKRAKVNNLLTQFSKTR